MELVALISEGGTPLLLLGLVIMVVRQTVQMSEIRDDLRDIKKNKPWSDTCVKVQEGFDKRITRIEALINGGRK